MLSTRTSLSGRELSLTVPVGGEMTADSVTAKAGGEVVWRIQATSEGNDEATLHSPGGTIAKRLVASPASRYVSATRTGKWWERLLLAPGESGFSVGAVTAVSVDYPSREIGLGGLSAHRVVWFLCISILTGKHSVRGVSWGLGDWPSRGPREGRCGPQVQDGLARRVWAPA